jgi:hypothetical protein
MLRSDSNPTLSKNTLISLIWRELFNVSGERVLVYEEVDIEATHIVIEEHDCCMSDLCKLS